MATAVFSAICLSSCKFPPLVAYVDPQPIGKTYAVKNNFFPKQSYPTLKEMINNESLDYGDSIRQFSTIDDLIQELNRLDGTIAKSQEENSEQIVLNPISTTVVGDNLPVATQVERVI